jgi:hypothetical protein
MLFCELNNFQESGTQVSNAQKRAAHLLATMTSWFDSPRNVPDDCLLANVLLDQDPVVVQGQENSALDVTGPFDIHHSNQQPSWSPLDFWLQQFVTPSVHIESHCIWHIDIFQEIETTSDLKMEASQQCWTWDPVFWGGLGFSCLNN